MNFPKIKTVINPNKVISDYQGFTGSNYLEDDLERAKHGGIVAGFNHNTPQFNLPIESPENSEIEEVIPDTAKKLKDSFRQYNELKDNARKFFSDWSAKTAEEARKKYDPNTSEGWEQFNKIMEEDDQKRDEYDKKLFKPIIDKAYQNLENAISDEYNTYKKTDTISPEFKEIQKYFSPDYFKQRFNDSLEDSEEKQKNDTNDSKYKIIKQMLKK